MSLCVFLRSWQTKSKYSIRKYSSVIEIQCKCLDIKISQQSKNGFQKLVNPKYFSTITNSNRVPGSISNKGIRQPLLPINHKSLIIQQKRSLSFTWLDDLAVSQSKWFKSLAESSGVEKLMSLIQYVHDTMNIPWWLTVVISTIFLRSVVTFPLAIYQNYIFAKVENLHPEMEELVKELKQETAIAIRRFNWDENYTKQMYNRSARRIWKELIIRENCHPFKASLLLWAQIPLWVMLTVSLRNMSTMMPLQDMNAHVIFMGLSCGGFGWIPNLVEADHSLILPIAMAIFNILNVDINASSRNVAITKRQKTIGNFFKLVSACLIPIAAYVPSCVVLYWTTSSFYGLIQNLILLHPNVKRRFGIPQTRTERADPYSHLLTSLRQKYLFIKKEN